MITTVDEAVKRIEAAYWRRYESRPEMQEKLKGKTRTLQLHIRDDPAENHWFHLADGKLEAVRKGTHEKADASITVTKADLLAILNGEMKAMQAYVMGKVKVRASFTDLLFAKSLLGI